MIPLGHYLLLSAVLFAIGTAGVFLRRNLITILLSIEIMLNAVNLAALALGAFIPALAGQGAAFALLIIAVAWMIAFLLWPFRAATHPVIEATWLSARNDVIVSTLYAVVMLAARLMPSLWPQMLVDGVSACLCLQAGAKVIRDALRNDAAMQKGGA